MISTEHQTNLTKTILTFYIADSTIELKKYFIKIVYRFFLYLYFYRHQYKKLKYETELLFILDIVVTLEWM